MDSETDKIVIDRAQPEDAWGITYVLHRTWVATYPNAELGITAEMIEESYKDSFTEESISNLQRKIKNSPESERRLVARQNGSVIGMATMLRNEGNNQLKTIYVLPEFQGKGVGKALWAEAKKFCDPAKDTIVLVATYNRNAIEFYKKLGFVDTGKRFNDAPARMKEVGVIIPEMELVLKAGE